MNNVLFIEDSEAHRTLIECYLEARNDCIYHTTEEVDESLIEAADIIFIDYHLGNLIGTNIAKDIQRRYPEKHIYIYTSRNGIRSDFPVIPKGDFRGFMSVLDEYINT